MAPCMPATSDPPLSSRALRICSRRRLASMRPTTSVTTAAATSPATTHAAAFIPVAVVGGSQPAAIETTNSSTARVASPNSHSSALTREVRSAPCSAPATAISAALPIPAAAVHSSPGPSCMPDNAETSPVSRVATTPARTTTSQSRPPSRRRRLSGASISQKPSAAEARTGPNSRAIASVDAKQSSTVTVGIISLTTPHSWVVQAEAPDCAFRMTLTAIAPSMRTLNTAT